MTLDPIWGSVLTLTILIPTVVRPFFKKLQPMAALTLLSPFSVLCAVLLFFSQGLSAFFLITATISISVFITNIPYLVRFIGGVHVDWYSPLFSISCAIHFLCIIAALFMCWYFKPETPAYAMQDMPQMEYVYAGTMRYALWRSDEEPKGYVIYLREDHTPAHGRKYSIPILSSKGYTIISPDHYKAVSLKDSVFITHFASQYASYRGKDMVIDETFLQNSTTRLYQALSYVYTLNQKTQKPVFFFTEGRLQKTVEQYLANPIKTQYAVPVQGVFSIVDKDFSADSDEHTTQSEGNNSLFHSAEIAFQKEGISSHVVQADICVVRGESQHLLEFGDITAQFPVEAQLLGGERDTAGKNAILLAHLADTYFTRRIAYATRVSDDI